MAKSDAERQRALTAKRTAGGWKRMWIPPKLVERVRKLLDELDKL